MRRKYDLRNKKNFVIILILSIAVICVFSLFIYRYKHAKTVQYRISAESVIQDINKNFLELTEDALLKIRWNGNYYLEYQDNKINLAKNVIVYNKNTGLITLYGTYYEIDEKGNVDVKNEETSLKNSTDTKFYKIADREYLLVDRIITNDDRSIEGSGYLLVELDKLGNAKLSNHKLNLKTIAETTLVTSKYTFDINNEILSFGKKEIDLKKIIGSTNEYENKKLGDGPDSTGEGTGTGDGTGEGAGGGGGAGGENYVYANDNENGAGNGTGVINGNNEGEPTDIEDLKDKTKTTSIIKPTIGFTSIDIDYVVYDPYNEYLSVYAEVTKPGKIETIYLSKNDTHMTINDLLPNTEYNIKFIYTTSVKSEEDGTEQIIAHTFDNLNLKTKKPNYTYDISYLKISKLDNTILTYGIDVDNNYNIDKVYVNLSFNYNYMDMDTSEVDVKKASLDGEALVNGNKAYGSFDITGYDIDESTFAYLTIVSVNTSGGTIEIGKVKPFRFGGSN